MRLSKFEFKSDNMIKQKAKKELLKNNVPL